ncbi:hypothetical protein OF83DRAFT_1081790 [Amylostereum chailletii]|nr:hypothetical protein OF83DRAFT_1081790 [Amylostereum chailletii]
MLCCMLSKYADRANAQNPTKSVLCRILVPDESRVVNRPAWFFLIDPSSGIAAPKWHHRRANLVWIQTRLSAGQSKTPSAAHPEDIKGMEVRGLPNFLPSSPDPHSSSTYLPMALAPVVHHDIQHECRFDPRSCGLSCSMPTLSPKPPTATEELNLVATSYQVSVEGMMLSHKGSHIGIAAVDLWAGYNMYDGLPYSKTDSVHHGRTIANSPPNGLSRYVSDCQAYPDRSAAATRSEP